MSQRLEREGLGKSRTGTIRKNDGKNQSTSLPVPFSLYSLDGERKTKKPGNEIERPYRVDLHRYDKRKLYRKIAINSPGLLFVQKAFLMDFLFSDGLVIGRKFAFQNRFVLSTKTSKNTKI